MQEKQIYLKLRKHGFIQPSIFTQMHCPLVVDKSAA